MKGERKVPKYFTKKQNMWFAAKLTSMILLGLFVLFVTLLYLNSAFGWFAMNEDVSGGGAGVRSSGHINPNVHAWRFDIVQNNAHLETGEDFIKDGVWVDALDAATTADPNDLVSVEVSPENDQVDTETFRFISLHLGTVDNLLDLSDDNCFYIRLDMTADVIGNRGAAVNLRHNIVGMEFYSSGGALIDAEDLGEAYDRLRGLVDIDCAVSATAYDMTTAAGATAVKALFTTKIPQEQGQEQQTVTPDANYVEIPHGETGAPVYAPQDNSPYYIYIRMRPDLETCFDATHDISVYMPCQILFNMEIEVGFEQ